MTSWHDFFVGLGIGALVAALVWVIYIIRLGSAKRRGEKENKKLKDMLSSRMELESEGIDKMKKEIAELKSQNENLRISLQTMSQKPGRKEVERLNVYQTAVDRLTINSPGFGPAWQAALKESEDEFAKTYTGVLPFVRRVLPGRTSAQLLEAEDAETND